MDEETPSLCTEIRLIRTGSDPDIGDYVDVEIEELGGSKQGDIRTERLAVGRAIAVYHPQPPYVRKGVT